jgi:hypothetical protein
MAVKMIIYHASGVIAALLFLIIVYILKKEKAERVKSYIFLNYKRFRSAFYFAAFGAVLFVTGNILGLYNHEQFHWLHEITEIVYNLCIAVFALLLFIILRPNLKVV